MFRTSNDDGNQIYRIVVILKYCDSTYGATSGTQENGSINRPISDNSLYGIRGQQRAHISSEGNPYETSKALKNILFNNLRNLISC